MRNYKNWIIALIFLLIVITVPTLVHADIDPGGDPDAPFDGGLGILLIAGVGYGVKKFRDHRNENKNI